MKTSLRFLTLAFTITVFGSSLTSCSKASVADEDALYENTQGIDKHKITVPKYG